MHSIQTPIPNTNYLNYTVRNRSCATTETSNLHLYWTIARMHEYWAHDWKNFSRGAHYADNKVVYSGSDKPLGNEITITDPFDYGSAASDISIPGIAGGGTYTNRKAWVVPNPDWYKNGSYAGQYPIQFSSANSNPVICLLARLDEPWKTENGYVVNPSETDKTDIVYYAKANNNVVTKNSFILNSLDGYIWQPASGNPRSRSGEIIVNPPIGANPDPIHIGIIRDTLVYDSVTPPDFTQHGQVNLYLDILLWNRWVEGGMVGENIEVIDDQFIKVTNSNFAKLENIQLYEGEMSKIAIETEYFEANPPETDYDYSFAFGSLDLSTNTLLGSPTIFEAAVLSTPTIDEGGGEYLTSVVTKKVSDNTNFNIYPNPTRNYVYVNFKADNNDSYDIKIMDMSGKTIQTISKDFKVGTNVFKLDLQEFKEGIYLINLSNGSLSYTKRLAVNK
jgi:hypothetical protein